MPANKLITSQHDLFGLGHEDKNKKHQISVKNNHPAVQSDC